MAGDRLIASLDATGSVVLHTKRGDIRLYVADGKMEVVRRDRECEECTSANLEFAKELAEAWNNRRVVVERARVNACRASLGLKPVRAHTPGGKP